MKIGIITIATGRYNQYVPELLESCESFFLPDHKKTYFVFTDGDIKSRSNVVKIHQDKLGWPFDSMLRFHMFLEIKEELLKMDYIFFMNANNQVVSTVDDSILPVDSECGIVATIHPGFFNRDKISYSYERRPESSLCVNFGSENNYYQGCFNGGRSKSFIEMSELLKSKIDEDLSNKIIPIWHDESALNWYLVDKDPLVLNPNYAYPEHLTKDQIINNLAERGITIDNEMNSEIISITSDDPHSFVSQFGTVKIMQRNKNKDGGKPYLRS